MWLLAIASFASVFFKGFQHQNVIGGKYKAAFFVSYVMAMLDVFVISQVASAKNLESAIMVGLGASVGIVMSMIIYRRMNNE